MKKHSKLLKSLIAIVLSILLIGSVVPTMAFAAAEETVSADEVKGIAEKIDDFFKNFFASLKKFIENIINLFKKPSIDKPAGTEVATAEDLIEAITASDKVYLSEDVTLDAALEIENDVEINLNGKTLSVDRLVTKSDVTVFGGTYVQGETEIKDEYGFLYDDNSAVYVDGGTLTFNDAKIITSIPSRIQINNNSVTETVAIHVVGGDIVLNNTEIVVENKKVYGKLLQYEGIFVACVDGGSLTMNNCTATLAGIGGRDGHEYIAFISNGNAESKIINLNNTQINGADYYAASKGSKITINTTDDASLWAGKYANCTVNFVA